MSRHFRDPIHGFIEVSELELKIIDSFPFQRLRNIKQLATTYLVYPGAEHTRFSHSLGVMHLVTLAFNHALENYRKRFQKPLFDSLKEDWYRQILRLIALTHDLGHAPFSHASEMLFEEGAKHEDLTKKIICETEIRQLINEIGTEFQKKKGVNEKYNITPELLWLIYGGSNKELLPEYNMAEYKFLKSFMDSELDCDKMDYLLRDSYFCGVNYGKYDLNRLLSSLNVYCLESEKIMQLAINRGGLHAFEEFLIARYHMFIQVYFHKTRRYLDRVLFRNIQEILPNGKYPSDVKEYLKWDDVRVIELLRNREEQTSKSFMEREIMSCVYETVTHSNQLNDATVFGLIRRELNKRFGDSIIEDTASKEAHKIPILEEYDAISGKGIPVLTDASDKPSSISVESALLNSMVRPINIRRLYVKKENSIEAKLIVKNMCDQR